MIIIECKYQHLDDGYSLVICNFNVGNEMVLRSVKTKDLIVEPSSFIGLKFNDGIELDTTKIIKVKKQIDIVSLFDDDIKEDIQLGLF